MDVVLKQEILDKLSHRGIMAYVAVSLAWNVEASTAVLASLVRVQTAMMREGLQELAVASVPAIVRPAKKGYWACGDGTGEPGALAAITWNDSSTRYAVFVDDLKKFWDHTNPEIPFSMGAKDGQAIRRFLTDHRDWEQHHWRQALNNRSKSVVNRSAPFFTWIAKLSEHAAGPLNEYNKPQEGTGKHGAAIGVEQSNRTAREQVLAAAGNGTREKD